MMRDHTQPISSHIAVSHRTWTAIRHQHQYPPAPIANEKLENTEIKLFQVAAKRQNRYYFIVTILSIIIMAMAKMTHSENDSYFRTKWRRAARSKREFTHAPTTVTHTHTTATILWTLVDVVFVASLLSSLHTYTRSLLHQRFHTRTWRKGKERKRRRIRVRFYERDRNGGATRLYVALKVDKQNSCCACAQTHAERKAFAPAVRG